MPFFGGNMKVRIKPKLFVFIPVVIGLILLIGGLSWLYLISPVDRNSKEDVKIEIKSGTNTSKIGELLKEKKVIKSKTLFRLYVKINHVSSLKAGTYRFSKSMSLNEVIKLLEDGRFSYEDSLKLTFKPGDRITVYAKTISNNTNNSYDDVINTINNKEYLKTLIDKYWFLTDKILNDDIYYALEGYLAPDTYYFDSEDVKVEEIITRMLDEEEDNLEKYKSVISSDVHYYITMASVIQLEGTTTDNRKEIVGVFKNRLSSGYNMGSDVTTYYALQIDMKEDLKSEQFATINPYNTRAANMIGKMPVGPVCNPGLSSIEASAYPAENDYLFFVADKHGNIYFSKTNAEHNKKIAEIKAKGDWIF